MRFPTLLGGRVSREADPRLRQLAATHRHLAALPPAYLQRLFETALDGSSHRLDAWLTARATAELTGHLAARGHWTRPGPMTYDDLADQSAYLPPGTLVADPDTDESTGTQSPGSVRIGPGEPVDYDEEVVRATAVAAAAGRLHRLTVAGGSPTTTRLLDRFDAFADRPLPDGVVGAHRQLSYLSDSGLPDDDTSAAGDAYDRMRAAIANRTPSAVARTRFEGFVDTLEAYAATGDGYTSLRDRLSAIADTAEESTLETLVAVLAVLPTAATAARETRRPDDDQYTDLPARADRRTSGRVHVGGYAFVEDLHPDDGGDPGEYVHAPSVEQATTAAVLRGGHAAFEADGGDGTVSSIDLSADRVRDAKRLLEGLRDGHTLGALLGYRVERRLHETDGQRHIDALRRAFPALEGSLGDRPTATEAARSDVLDGAALHRSLQDGTYPTAADLPARTDPSVAPAFDALHDSMDALTDLLTAESVHQFTRGNYDRANAVLDTLETGGTVPEPEVTDTPRTGVGVTHRLLVGAADADGVTQSDAWRSDVQVDRPALPAAGDSPETPSLDPTDRAVRTEAEPTLERWAAEHLPDPSTVGCRATYRWTRQRGVSAGTVASPATDGETTVSDLGFQPDLIRFTATPAVGPDGEDLAATTGRTGWAHGFAGRAAEGTIDQRSVGVGAGEDGTATSVVSTDAALTVAVHDTETSVGRIEARVTGTTDDGFTLSWTVDDDALSGEAPRVDVSYIAYATGGADGVSVGHETITADATDTPTLQLPSGADTVWTLATDAAESVPDGADPGATAGRTDAAPVTLSHGSVVRADAVVQRAATTTLTPGGDRVVAAHDDRAIHFPSADAPTTATAGVAGASIELGFDGVPDRDVVVLYAAVDSRGSPPVLGTITGEETPLDTRPGAIEFTSVPGGTSVGSRVSASTLAHGRALGTTDQAALHVATDGEGGVHGASTRVGIGTAAAGVCANVSGVTADGFTLDTGGSEADAVTFYLAWARDPETVTRDVQTTVSVADLGLSALDVVYGSTGPEEGARTPMEDHVAYHLLRTRRTADPAVPANATVELALRDAPDWADTSVAELLVVGRCVRDVLEDARPATADDLLPPGRTRRDRIHRGDGRRPHYAGGRRDVHPPWDRRRAREPCRATRTGRREEWRSVVGRPIRRR
ncbi:hypothetical protein [Halobellus marinus]|uniref:hypothetical protein n=1 Tax=Halobellus marinus TaxID=3075123 RepID=UPI0028A78EAD|nr:hypothetical protein [Halobellus sp. DFY28]